MKIRVKDIWMRRTAVERVLKEKLPSAEAARLSVVGEPLWDAYIAYQHTRKQAWYRLGLDKEEPESDERQARLKQFENEMREQEQDEIEIDPVPVAELPSLSLSTVDMAMMQQLGVLRGL